MTTPDLLFFENSHAIARGEEEYLLVLQYKDLGSGQELLIEFGRVTETMKLYLLQ